MCSGILKWAILPRQLANLRISSGLTVAKADPRKAPASGFLKLRRLQGTSFGPAGLPLVRDADYTTQCFSTDACARSTCIYSTVSRPLEHAKRAIIANCALQAEYSGSPGTGSLGRSAP